MIGKIFLTIFIITSGSTLAIAFIYADGRTVAYWYTVIWVLFLIFLNWLTSIIVLEPDKEAAKGVPGSWVAIFPFISGLTIIYSLCSLVPVSLWWSSPGFMNTSLLFACQIAMFSLYGVIVLIAILARYFAAYEAESVFTKTDFLGRIKKVQRMRESEQDLALLKEMYDYVAYHMPHPSKLDPMSLTEAITLLDNADKNLTSQNDLSEALKILKSA